MELFVIGVVAFALIAALGLAAALISFLVWLVVLPFQILGLALKFVGFLIAVPILFVVGLIVASAVGFGALFLFAPLLPFVLAGLVLLWVFRRPKHRHGQVAGQPTS